MTILAADIGGTNARFAVVSRSGDRFVVVEETTLASRRLSSLEDALGTFLDTCSPARRCRSACFGVAGPIRDGRCETTNLPWVVDAGALARTLSLPRVELLNDVEAAAWGLAAVGAGELRTLHPGTPEIGGNRALLAPGTGLGEAGLVWDGERYHPFATEGSHADFAPADEEQIELWRYLARRHGHVSWERIASGPGLISIFRFFLEQTGAAEPPWLERALLEGGGPAAISRRAANEGGCPLCRKTLRLFFAVLGAEAGNLALKVMATGGVYLVGGIVPKLLGQLAASPFLDAFTAKGRFRSLLESIPVRAVLDDRVGLWGAAARAIQHLPVETAASGR